MESDVAKPLRMLSAYLMTAAMTRPPSAWRNNKHTDTDGQRRSLCAPTLGGSGHYSLWYSEDRQQRCEVCWCLAAERALPAESPRPRWLCCSPGASPTPSAALHRRPASQKPQRPGQTYLETRRNTHRWWDYGEELTAHHITAISHTSHLRNKCAFNDFTPVFVIVM